MTDTWRRHTKRTSSVSYRIMYVERSRDRLVCCKGRLVPSGSASRSIVIDIWLWFRFTARRRLLRFNDLFIFGTPFGFFDSFVIGIVLKTLFPQLNKKITSINKHIHKESIIRLWLLYIILRIDDSKKWLSKTNCCLVILV